MTPPQSPSQIDEDSMRSLNFAETDLPIATIFPPSGDRVCQSGERIGVSPFRLGYDLTPSEREAAIEVCELRECFYEQAGQHQLAEFMRQSRAQLEASRQGEQE